MKYKLIKKRHSLFMKILFVSTICMVIPMLVSLYYVNHSTTNVMEAQAKSFLSSIGNEKAQETQSSLNEILNYAKTVANEPYTVDFFNELSETKQADPIKKKRIEENLEKELKDANGLFENIFLAYDGRIIVDGVEGKSVGYEIKKDKDPWLDNVLKNNLFIGNVLLSPITGRPIMIIGSSVINNNTSKAIGGLAISVDLTKLAENIVKQNSSQNVKTLLLNSSGMVISSQNASQILNFDFSKEKGDVQEFYKQMKSNKSGIGYFTMNTTRNIASFVKCSNGDLYFVSYMPINQYMSPVNSLKNDIILVMIISIFISAFIILLLSYGITKPIKVAVDYIKTMSTGDFTLDIPEQAMKDKDEIGMLMNCINAMKESINFIIKTALDESKKMDKVVIIADSNVKDLNNLITEISSTTEELSAGIEETAASAEEMSASTDEIEKSIKSMAVRSEEGVQASVEISKRALGLKETAITSKKTAEQIRESIDFDLRKAIEQSKAVEEINELTESILQITTQTDLLALNAAIEAARAGEAGKGFAVVADEVRKLAENSKNNANQIRKVTKFVISSVNNLKLNSEKALDFIDSIVIKDYKAMVNTGIQYHNDAKFIESLANDVNGKTSELSTSMNSLIQAIYEVSVANNESSEDTSNIVAKTYSILQKSNDIIKVSNEVKESSERLKSIMLKFKI